MSDRLFVKLKEQNYYTVSVNATIDAFTVFRGNDIYDPQYSIGGGQPTGFKQYFAFYNNSYVAGSKIKVTVFSDGPAEAEFYIWPTKYASVAITGFDPSEQPMYIGKFMSGSSANSRSGTVLSSYRTTKQMLISNIPMDEQDNWGTDAASPVKQWYWWFGCRNAAAVDACAFTFKVEITYYVQFIGRKQMVNA